MKWKRSRCFWLCQGVLRSTRPIIIMYNVVAIRTFMYLYVEPLYIPHELLFFFTAASYSIKELLDWRGSVNLECV